MEQKRFFLAMTLSALVLVFWQMFFAPQPPDEAAPGEETQQTASDVDEDQGAEDGEAERASESDGEGEEASGGEDASAQPAARAIVEPRLDKMRSEHFEAVLTNEGGSVVQVTLHSPAQYIEAGDLIGFPKNAPAYPFETHFTQGNFDFPAEVVFEVAEDDSLKDSEGYYERLVYRYDDPEGRFRVDKIFTIEEERAYILKMDVEVTNRLDDVNLVDALAVDSIGWKDPDKETSWLDFLPNQTEGVCRLAEDTEREVIDSIEEPLKFDDDPLWGATDTRYFMLAVVPLSGAEKCEMEVLDAQYVRTRLTLGTFSVSPGESTTLAHELYLGPKDVDVLEEAGHQLSESVDYGFFSFIARPMRWGLNFVQGFVGNWGLAIILLTFLIRGLIWPINMKAYSSMERMKEVQPELEKIREKYGDDRQKMGDETMKLFRENNVSPLGGCLPMLLQMPILYGLYVMIYNSVELYQADFMLWYDNLAVHDPYYVLPALMGVTMVAQQKMSTVDTSNKQAAMMMKVMPVMFTAFMAFLPSGLVLYYFFSLLIGVGQQFYVKRKFRTQGDAEAANR